ncbi:MAG TPA: DNA polymerase III subunit delta [Planctomycetaceae bacterium]|jgi:DNA polymerase-3 subunit delta|nr:DNA polymerase III subunit delta [Planctomycetaceae bacterium]
MHAVALLRSKTLSAIGPIAVLFGEERHLKRAVFERLVEHVLGGDEESLGLTRFAGDDADLKTVCDELLTVSMWGDRRLVVVDAADRFVSQYREGLEKYLGHPARKSVLVLDVKSWPKTTRLAKAVAKIGLEIECSPLSGAELLRWLTDAARAEHGKTLPRDAASLMRELAGEDLDLLEQELAKLAAFVGDRTTIEADDVRMLVGGWRTETTWAIAGALRRGRTGEALDLLDNLLNSGESPHKIVAGLTFVFRRLAQSVERVREGASLDVAVREAGVFPREAGESVAYLKRLGRSEALRLYSHLLWADVNLKGGLTIAERQILETLVVNLGGTSVLPRRK